MEVKKIKTQKLIKTGNNFRPTRFDEFIGQDDIKKALKSAIVSSQKTWNPIGHILFSGPSGFGKTTLAQIVAKELGVQIKIIAWYAISKPAELISILTSLEEKDILFIDEIHRLKPTIEEILYIAMEDFAIDMVMPEGGNVRVDIAPFTLIGATTRLESLSPPLKNRFVYKFHFQPYTHQQKEKILKRYLAMNGITTSPSILKNMVEMIVDTPREISNFAIQLKDFLISSYRDTKLNKQKREEFKNWAKLEKWGLAPIHKAYLQILKEADGKPVGLKTIALKLGVNEKSVEQDIEPLLLKLGLVQKTSQGRMLNS